MSVRAESEVLPRPLTAFGSSGYDALSPPLRQAAGRYVTFSLLRWYIVSIILITLRCVCSIEWNRRGYEIL